MEIGDAWQQLGTDTPIQGNLDPIALLGPESELEKQVAHILDQVGGRPGHIFNLGHGILPQTPISNVSALVEMVHTRSRSEGRTND